MFNLSYTKQVISHTPFLVMKAHKKITISGKKLKIKTNFQYHLCSDQLLHTLLYMGTKNGQYLQISKNCNPNNFLLRREWIHTRKFEIIYIMFPEFLLRFQLSIWQCNLKMQSHEVWHESIFWQWTILKVMFTHFNDEIL